MEYRKALLKAASLLALTAATGAQSPANASISPDIITDKAQLSSAVSGDPLFELMKRTNGSLTMRSVESALRGLFGDLSSAQMQMLPKSLASLAGLGATTATVEKARQVLVELVSGATSISEDVRGSIVSDLQAEESYQVAQNRQNNRRRRDPDEVGQVPGGGGAS